MKRRSFIQTAIAVSGAFFLPVSTIFRKIKPTSKVETFGQLQTVSASPDACRYIYNPGLDLDGVQDLTFHQHSTIPGGKVTKIGSWEEWSGRSDIYPLPSNPIRVEKVENAYCTIYSRWNDETGKVEMLDPPVLGYEQRTVVAHSAQEITSGLLSSLRPSNTAQMLVEIKEWRGREIDIDRVNAMIYSNNLEGRIVAIKERRSWINSARLSGADLTILSGVMLAALGQYGAVAGELLKKRIQETPAFDAFQQRLTKLFFPEESQVAEATARLAGTKDDAVKRLHETIKQKYSGYMAIEQSEVDAFRERVKHRLETNVS